MPRRARFFMSSFRKIISYIWPQIKKHQSAFYWILLIFGLRTVLDNIVRPIYFKKIVDLLSLNDKNHSILTHDLFVLISVMIGISFLVLITARFGKFIIFAFEINVVRELRNFCFEKIQGHSQTFFSNTFSGSLVTKSRRFVGAFEMMADVFIFNFYSTALILLGAFVVIFSESKLIAGLFFLWIALYLLIIFIFLKKKFRYDVIEAAADSKIGGRLADVFGNILAVKIFSAKKSEITSFHEVTNDASNKSRKAWFFGGKMELIQGILTFLVQSSLLYVMIKLWLNGKITTGTVVLVQTYMVIIFDKLWDLANALTKFMKSGADMKEMIDIFEVTSDIVDPKNPQPLAVKAGHLVFNNVSFAYKDSQEFFRDFNLDIKSGERIGLVGHSGSGKSTITSLILRFMDVSLGSITIDGQDIKDVTQDDLRSAISYVPQESILFHRTIRDNIAYGKRDATDEEIVSVAQKAHAHEFISKLPKGYDTKVGERGVKLSGGERQRVAIARAMLKNAPILVLDEATSSLDSISESYIQDALGELMNEKTSIVIAHRLSTIQKMDRIVVLDHGKIVEEGTHQKLLENNGIYKSLWDHQTGGFLPNGE